MPKRIFSKQIAVLAVLAVAIPSLVAAKNSIKVFAESDNGAAIGLKVKIKIRTVAGKVTSVSSSNFVLKSSNGTEYTVTPTANAKVVRRFGAAAKLSDIQANDKVEARGKVDGNNISASFIRDLSLQARNGTFRGNVKSVGSNSFVLATKGRGDQSININSSTVFKKNNSAASFSDVKAGALVEVSGVWDRANDNVTAKSVRIIVKIVNLDISGTLTAKTDTMLTVTGNNGTIYKIDITKAKLLRRNGGKASLSEYSVGDKVRVRGKAVLGSTDVSASLVKDLSIKVKR